MTRLLDNLQQSSGEYFQVVFTLTRLPTNQVWCDSHAKTGAQECMIISICTTSYMILVPLPI